MKPTRKQPRRPRKPGREVRAAVSKELDAHVKIIDGVLMGKESTPWWKSESEVVVSAPGRSLSPLPGHGRPGSQVQALLFER